MELKGKVTIPDAVRDANSVDEIVSKSFGVDIMRRGYAQVKHLSVYEKNFGKMAS